MNEWEIDRERRHRAMAGVGLLPLNWVTNGIRRALAEIIRKLLGTVLEFMLGLIEELLFFPSPEDMALTDDAATIAFIAILTVGWLVTLLSIQLFPGSSKADPYRLLERTFIGVILVVASEMMFDFAIQFTNAVGLYFYPTTQEIMDPLTRDFSSVVATSIGLVAVYYLIGGLLLLAVASFIGTLLLRVFIVYTLYVLFPLFVAFWIFDFGIGEHTKKFADMFFKAGAMTLAVGIVIAAVLSAGVVIADPGGGDSTAQFSESPDGTQGDDIGGENQASGACLLPTDKEPEDKGCIIHWSSLLTLIGIGGAMVVSTGISLMGISSVTSGGGAVTGAISGAVAGTLAGGGGGGGGSGGSRGEQGPEPGEGGGEPAGGGGAGGAGGGADGGGASGVGSGAAATTTKFQTSSEQSPSGGSSRMDGGKLNPQPVDSGGQQSQPTGSSGSESSGGLREAANQTAAVARQKAMTGGGKAIGAAVGGELLGPEGAKAGGKIGEKAGEVANEVYDGSAAQAAVHEKAGQMKDVAGEKLGELKPGGNDQEKAGHDSHGAL